MRDLKLFYTTEEGFDIDIEGGYPVYVDRDNQTQDQRAAIGAVFEKGTMPGNLSVGVDWSALYDKDGELLSIRNDISTMIDTVAGGEGSSGSTYMPLFIPREDGSVSVTVLKGGV